MHRRTLRSSLPFAVMLAAPLACTARRVIPEDHDHSASPTPTAATMSSLQGTSLPAGASTVAQRLALSPRHGEWVMIGTSAADSVRAWVVFPERSTKAPVVLVVHEIFGLSTWIRGVADQLAADGFIAIAPDLLTGKVPLEADTTSAAAATSAIRTLKREDIHRQLEAVARYGMALPAAVPRYGIVGFCWGGGTSFTHAVESPAGLSASVVYYGTSPATAELSRVRPPVLGLYAGNDARVDATIPPADSAMKALGKFFEPHIFPGAGHGFLRAQESSEANLQATRQAWPLTISFFKKNLGA